MLRNMCKGMIAAFLVTSLLIVPSYADEAKRPITIAILPCYDIVKTFRKFHPLEEYLERKTEYEIRIIIQTDMAEFDLQMRNGDIDFALLDAHMYVGLAEFFQKDALLKALTPTGEAEHRGVVIVRKDSGISDVDQLRDKVIMFGPKQSIAKWLAAKILLEDNGIDIEKDLKTYRNGGCCEDIAFDVFLKAADAGVVCDHFIEDRPDTQMELGLDMDQIAVIAKTDLVPTRIFAAHKKVSKEIVDTFMNALLELDASDPAFEEMMSGAEVGGFQRTGDADYDKIRDLVRLKR